VEVQTIAVIGAGTMGRGIAYAAALAGYRTILLGEKYRPNTLLKQYVQEGRLDRKAGRGVYDYTQHDAQHGKP
jgi:3-hydroxyacyl-CoA dehydrogenase